MAVNRTLASALGVVITAAGLTGGLALGAGSRAPSITVTQPPPGIVNAGDVVAVAGRVRGAPGGSRALLELRTQSPVGSWDLAVRSPVARSGAFRQRWRVSGSGYRFDQWRIVVVSSKGRALAATAPTQVVIGPPNTPCDPPPAPGVLPAGDGWLVGGLYGEGGPAGAPVRCSGSQYTITATDSHGQTAATQTVQASHSYRLALPAGTYMLSAGGGCTGDGPVRVRAGRQVMANTYCRYP